MRESGYGQPGVWVYSYAADSAVPSEQRLRQAAAAYAARFGLPGAFERVAHEEKGKPYFPDAPAVGFSISHSADFWVCALAAGRIGVDVQQQRPCRAVEIARRFFHPDEAAFIQKTPERFYEVWAAKESYVKYTGQGIVQFGSFSVVEGGRLARRVEQAALALIPFHPAYRLCVCCRETTGLQLFRK